MVVLSSPLVLGFNFPLSCTPRLLVRSARSVHRLRMVATPIRTDEAAPTGEEWKGTSTLDRQLVSAENRARYYYHFIMY